MPSPERVEAQRRVDHACFLLESAFRLETLDVRDTLVAVQQAIEAGLDFQVEDAKEAMRKRLCA